MTEFYVKVRPDSDQFEIEDSSITKIKLEPKAENSKANAELVKKLTEVLGKKPGIISGHKSRRKKLQVEMSEENIEKKLGSWKNG